MKPRSLVSALVLLCSAFIPALGVAAEVKSSESSSDSFSNEAEVESDQQRRIDLYGFADLTYARLLIPESNPWTRIYFPTNWGAYGLVGYRTQFLQVMPYAILQYVYAPNDPVVPPVLGGQVGLNIHPTPAVVLKLELSLTHFTAPGSTGLGNYPLRFLATQVAWPF